MKLSNWFKIPWWILITGFTGYIFYSRWGYISEGKSAPVDIFIFLVLVALLLAPIFQEVSLFGLKFKQEVDKLKEHVSTQLAIFKADIQTVISNSVNTSVTVSSGTPPTDDQLPKIEEKIRETLREYLGETQLPPIKESVSDLLTIDKKTQFLFQTRYLIEKNLREITAALGIQEEYRRPIPISKLTSILINHELLNPKIAHAIREVYSVCSPAIHGEEYTDAQFEFVRDIGPEIIRSLEKLKAEQGV
ncbi:hypothetical protein [Desulfotignum balticum]|uniref:hypothetical protein n=1 Tax=Desulfotignum balticum TaxID=115781 RepID=UPI000462AF97|nr:hypothetical protein [Desulfotignum balticum]